jgi:hypothetical protein
MTLPYPKLEIGITGSTIPNTDIIDRYNESNYPYHLKYLSSFRKPNYLYIFCNSVPSENRLLKKATFGDIPSNISLSLLMISLLTRDV